MSGYGDTKRRRPSSSRGREVKRDKGRKEKKEKKHREPDDRSRKTYRRSSRSRQRSPPQAAVDQKAPPPAAAQHVEEAVLGRKDSILSDKGDSRTKAAWREELSKAQGAAGAGDDEDAPEGIVEDENEDDVAKRLQESRLRREALIAKWVNKGETANGSSGTLETPDTPMGEVISDSDEEGVFSEERPQEVAAEESLDEESLQLKKDLQRFILQHKAEQDNMFDETADEDAIRKKASGQDAAISQTGASADDWDDAEGYYRAKIGEVMNERYLVTEDICGKGVFSNVCKATDKTDNSPVAIKIMRCNDMMKKAAEKEVGILERLNKADKQNKKHVIKMLRHFMYRGHLCVVFECMWDNLRVALKKYTKDKGMSLQAVRAYTRQLLIALRHLHRCQFIHCDIKPDNILISAGHNVVKICDLGSAMELTEVEPTPYLVSRFYRAPEIVLAAKYSFPLDVFALGGTLFELFTGKILFQGKNNNDMMRLFMEVKGKLPNKLIKSGNCWKQHFNEDMDFRYTDTNKATRKKIVRTLTDLSAKRSIADMVLARVGPEKQKSEITEDQLYVKKARQFADLMDKMTAMDPERRITAHDGLSHTFVAEAGPGSKPKEQDQDSKPKASKTHHHSEGKSGKK